MTNKMKWLAIILGGVVNIILAIGAIIQPEYQEDFLGFMCLSGLGQGILIFFFLMNDY